jgi:hypothetical protein
MPTENSVVVSLNEVRRLERERLRRQQEAETLRAQEERALALAQAEARRREEEAALAATASRYGSGPGPAEGPGGGGPGGAFDATHVRRRTYEVSPSSSPYGVAAGPTEGLDLRRGRSSWRGVVFVSLLLIGAGGYGFWELERSFRQKLLVAESARVSAEAERSSALATLARAEEESKTQLATCEAKVTRLLGEQERAATALASAAVPRIDASTLAAAKVRRAARFARRARTAKLQAQSRAAAVTKPKPPRMAPPREIQDDPLQGIKL